ncbi:MAG: dihydropteroate synthase [Terrimesophilobacter sp.]
MSDPWGEPLRRVRRAARLRVRSNHARAPRPIIMGILNVTPDSFSDGGRYTDRDAALQHASDMVAAGADIIDVGGESTRPGAGRLDAAEEQRRAMPIVRELIDRGIPVSIDTMNSGTAQVAVDAGAVLVNDVSGGLADTRMANIIADTGVRYVAMHWRGPSATMEANAVYGNVVRDVRDELRARIDELRNRGVQQGQIVLDPGIGFAKNAKQSWAVLGHLREFETLGYPVLVGASRKSFLGPLLPKGAPTDERDRPTAVISALAAEAGVWGVRVHDVAGTKAALDVWEAWSYGASAESGE